MNGDLKREVDRISKLKQNKELGNTEIEKQAKLNLHIREFRSSPLFTVSGNGKCPEQQIAEDKFKSYLKNYELDTISDIDTLRSLVYNEVLETRIQDELNRLSQKGNFTPDKLTKQLTEIQKQKLNLKVVLGIDKEEGKTDELTGLQTLEKRFVKYIQENRNQFTTACANCGTMLLLTRRVKDFECLEHPWFIGRWYFNYPMLKDVKDGKLSKEKASEYLHTSLDYINFCLENWQEILENYDPKKGN